jgi:hypothetical protein
MPLEYQPANKGSATLMEAEGIKPLDSETGGVSATIPVSALTGIANFSFTFFNGGGTDNLAPGRPTTQTASLQVPAGTTHGVISLRTVSGAFVNAGGATLTERALGQFDVDVSFGANNTLVCLARLTDSNGDDPVQVFVYGTVVFVR